jgi:adenine phosphoribosyltransferase
MPFCPVPHTTRDQVWVAVGASLGLGLGALARYCAAGSATPAAAATAPAAAAATTYEQDGAEARAIAAVVPYFPFKGIPRFYDISGFLSRPAVFQRIVDVFAARYAGVGIDCVAGLDARGFVLGPPIALALGKPFVMIRKKGKMPNCVESPPYECEYGKRGGMCCQKDAFKKGDRVLLIDDLVATGGTLSAGVSLIQMMGAICVECACVVELKMFINPPGGSGMPNRTKLFESLGFGDVPVWGLISEDILDVEAKLDENYVDDGEEH